MLFIACDASISMFGNYFEMSLLARDLRNDSQKLIFALEFGMFDEHSELASLLERFADKAVKFHSFYT